MTGCDMNAFHGTVSGRHWLLRWPLNIAWKEDG